MGGGVDKQARDERGSRGEGGEGRRGRGRQGYERSLVIDMPDITITLLIQRDINTDEVRASKYKGAGEWGGVGGARAADAAVTGFPPPSNSHFLAHSRIIVAIIFATFVYPISIQAAVLINAAAWT